MLILTESIALDFAGFLIALIAVTIAYFKWRFTYWQRRGVPTLNPKIPFGDNAKLILGQAALGEAYKELYDQLKAKKVKHGGVYTMTKAEYMPIDPDLLKSILVKDFDSFMNHGFHVDEEVDPLAAHLFNLEDDKWKNMRVKLSPTFTSGKMKMMFHTMASCANGLKDIMDNCAQNNEVANIQDMLARFSTDIIGSVAFGIECNSLKHPDAEFRKFGRKVFENGGFSTRVKQVLRLALPQFLLRLIKFKQINKEIETFFMDAIRSTVDYREKNNIYRKDFLHLLIQLKNRGFVADDEKLTDGGAKMEALTFNQLAAQAFVFFIAGFETSSTTMTFALYELATNQDIQDKLRKEINIVMENHNNQLTYECVQDMTYLNRVIEETLRKYPPIPFLPRECTKNYHVPGTSATIEKGITVLVSVLGIHHDPEYYPDPEKFDPDRFTEENKAKRPSMTWLPFGEGPRICIGMRFGLMQTKVGLITMLRNYRVFLNEKTVYPSVLAKRGAILMMQGGVWVNVEKI